MKGDKQTKQTKRTKKQKKLTNFDRVNLAITNKADVIPPSVIMPLDLIAYAGNVQKATFLARLIYLSDKGIRKDGFIWKSYSEWKEEIGLSKSQVERIVEDFQDKRKILIAKKKMAGSKNGNASYTYHYKLLIDKFLTDLKKFLAVRKQKNLKFEQEETYGSITKDTDIDTAEISLLEKNRNSREDINKNVIEENANVTTMSDYVDDIYELDDFICDDSSADFQGCLLPKDFEPTLENKIWSVTNYPYKSPKFITGKFIDYFTKGKGKNVRKTAEEWQKEWCNWVETEKSFGATKDSFEDEHNKIKSELIELIYDFIYEHEDPLVSYSEIFEQFCEQRSFEEEIIKYFLDHLAKFEHCGIYFECFYAIEKYKEDAGLEKLGQAMYRYIWNNAEDIKPREIMEFIKTNLVVSKSDLKSKFQSPEVSSYSLEKLLEIAEKFRYLVKVGDYYHLYDGKIINDFDLDDSEKWQRLDELSRKLAELGIND